MNGVNSQTSRKRVFVVEDDLPILEVIQQILEGEDYSVTSARNGKEALEVLAASSELPQLILLDLMMPIMDGTEFLARMRENPKWSALPVILMSADMKLVNRQLGAYTCLKKPVDLENFLNTLRGFFEGRPARAPAPFHSISSINVAD
ncbi:response regulator [bacterium]|jgi:CheY-like chemotaxis protein|nr:response regulator [bacterium]